MTAASASRGVGRAALALCPVWDWQRPHLGLACLRSVTVARGWEAETYDFNLEFVGRAATDLKASLSRRGSGDSIRLTAVMAEHLRQTLDGAGGGETTDGLGKVLSREVIRAAETLAAAKPDVVGFSAYASNMAFTLCVARAFKGLHPQGRVVLGGPQASAYAVRVVDAYPFVDYVVTGEGEETWLALLRFLEGSGECPEQGLATRTPSGEATWRPRPTVLADIGGLPIPDFGPTPPCGYATPALPLEWSRGCVGRCTFCAERGYWVTYRPKPTERVVEEIERLSDGYATVFFAANDSLLNGSVRQLFGICQRLTKRRPPVFWGGYARVKGMTPELLSLMGRAGCRHLFYGIESASPALLEAMGKDVTVKRMSDVLRWTSEAGIRAYGSFIVGLPGETETDVDQTLRFLERNSPYLAGVVFTVYRVDPASIDYARRQAGGPDDEKDRLLGLPPRLKGEDATRRLDLRRRVQARVHGELGIRSHGTEELVASTFMTEL